MKLCVDCANYRQDFSSKWVEFICKHEEAVAHTDLVTGAVVTIHPSIMRSPEGRCGIDAVLYEPKRENTGIIQWLLNKS